MRFEAHEHRFIAVEHDGREQVHGAWPGGGDYATLCGLDADDSMAGTRLLGTKAAGKITCFDCRMLINAARAYSRKECPLTPAPEPKDA